MRRLAQQLVLGVCPHLSLDAVTDAFASRSKRLVSPEQIEAYLETAPDPDVRLARLIDLAENVVGTYAKRVVRGVTFVCSSRAPRPRRTSPSKAARHWRG